MRRIFANSVSKQCCNNLMFLNFDKCQPICFSRENKPSVSLYEVKNKQKLLLVLRRKCIRNFNDIRTTIVLYASLKRSNVYDIVIFIAA